MQAGVLARLAAWCYDHRRRVLVLWILLGWQFALSEYIGGELQLPRPVEPCAFDPHHGWQEQGNGKWFYGLSIENGRIKDEGNLRLRAGLR